MFNCLKCYQTYGSWMRKSPWCLGCFYLFRKREVMPWTSWMTSPWRTGRGGLLTIISCLLQTNSLDREANFPACHRKGCPSTCRGLWQSTSCWRLWRGNRWPAAGGSCHARFRTWTNARAKGEKHFLACSLWLAGGHVSLQHLIG